MSTINYTYNVIVDRFRQFAAGHFQLRRFTHGEISQADLEKEAEWPWLHVKPRAINYSPGTRSFQFEIFISDLPRDKEDKTGYQAESITDCSLIFQDLINEIYLGNMFGDQVVLSRPVNSEPFVEQYTHTLTGVTGTIELQLDYDWSACSIPASWNYNTPTDSGSDGWGALQFIESLDQNGVFVSLDGDVEAPGNSYYYGTNSSGVKGWYQLIDQVGITCEDLPECATIISIVDDIAALQTDVTALQTDVTDLETNKVPYTGATGNVNLGEFELKAGQLSLDTSPTGTAAVGTTRWNDTIGSSETTLKGGSVILKNGVDLVARVVNKVTPNTTLTKAAYQAVRISGAQGQRLAVALAQANNDTNSADTIGVVTETIATNQEGFIMTVGNLEEINTTGSLQGETWADGDVLYLSPTTAGAITNVKPTGATGHIVVIGYVEYAHAIHGKIYVKVMNGWELDELHNVYIDTPINNNVLTYESSTSLWKNKTVATALGYTPVPETRTLTINGTTQDLSANRTFTIATGLTVGTTPITSGTVGRVLFEGTGNVLQESANLFWDNTNSRLGIGTASPAYALDVATDIRSLRLYTNIIRDSNNNAYVNNTVTNAATTDISIGNATAASITLTSKAAGKFVFTTGNVLIGTTTDAGFKLDVNGTARLNGLTAINGAGVANTALAVYGNGNGGGNYLFRMYDASAVERFFLTASGNFRMSSATDTGTSGDDEKFRLALAFAPTSGTRAHVGLYVTQTINQTGGANGITRGLYINPTLTAAADFRAIETTAGNVLFGASGTGFYWDNTNSRLGIGTAAPSRSLDIRGTARIENGGSSEFDIIGQTNNFRIGVSSSQALFGTLNAFALAFFTNASERARIFATTGNFAIGTTTDAGFKLDVNGTARVKGVGTTTGVTLRVENSAGTDMLRVFDNGQIYMPQSGGGSLFLDRITAYSSTSISIVRFFVGSGSISASADIQINSTTRGFLPPRMTTTQKNAIASPAEGLVVYDTTLGKLCVRGASAWETITSA